MDYYADISIMKLPAASSGVSTSHHSPHLRRKRRGIGPEEIKIQRLLIELEVVFRAL
jgi:hypothetical protein